MSVRKKNRLERLLSFNQHRKRFGAGKAVNNQLNKELQQLKNTMIPGNEPDYTHGAEKDITQHLKNLRAEFAGNSELLHYHASLIVMIRREYKAQENFRRFTTLWEQEQSYLLKHLNTRWLISAADTFADYAREPLVRALALNSAILFNTVKMQESERFLQQAENLQDDPERHARLTSGRVNLMDGTSAFAVGTDDTLRNMRWRIDDIAKLHPVGSLLTEIFQRLQSEDTVYQRFRERHTRRKTAWW
ncbi:MAG: hypothetical protein ACPGSM_06440 [Thiolinea sp.]